MFKSLRSQAYKMMHSPLFCLSFLWPIPFVGLVIAYYSVSGWSPEQKMTSFFQALSLVMMGLAAWLSTYAAQQEQRAGACFNILCVGQSRIRTFVSIVVLLAMMTSVGLILSAAGFAWLYGQMLPISYVLTTILMLIPLACILLIHLFIAFNFGASWSIGVGAIFLLVGALGMTGLLNSCWYYLPPTWAPRFTALMIADVFHPDHILPIAAEMRHGLMYCLLATIVIAILVPGWFHKWDGKPDISDESFR